MFVFGQTFGNYPISNGAWGTPQFRKQFIHKISADLSSSMASTAFGSPQGNMNLVPTAFNIDDCLNILLSGWGGTTNSAFTNTSVEDLPISTDALQNTSNGSDFYFMVLGNNFTTFKWFFFGGAASAELWMEEPQGLMTEVAFIKRFVQAVEETMTYPLPQAHFQSTTIVTIAI